MKEDQLDRVKRLFRLFEEGLLTEDEFQVEKNRLFGVYEDHAAVTICSGERGMDIARFDGRVGGRARLVAIGLTLVVISVTVLMIVRPFGGPKEVFETAKNGLPDLSELIQFEDPTTCSMDEPLEHLFGDLTQAQNAGDGINVASLEAKLAPSVKRTHTGDVEASLRLNGEWHGLTVSRLFVSYRPNSDMITRQIRFLEPPGKVRVVFNELGFALPAVGHSRVANQGAYPVHVSIENLPGGSALECSQ